MGIKVFALGSEILFYNELEKWRPRRTPVRVRLWDGLCGRLKQRILAIRTGGRHFEKFGIYFVICRPYVVRKYVIKKGVQRERLPLGERNDAFDVRYECQKCLCVTFAKVTKA